MVQQRDLDDTAQRQTSSRVRVNLKAYKKELTGIQLSIQERTAHLPKLIADVIFRLRLSAAARVNPSVFARQHSELRRKQRLHRSNAGRRFANPGSEHLQHSAQESPNYSCRQVAARHHNYRRRSGFAVEANDAQLHGPFPWNKIAGVQLTRNRPAQGTSRFLRWTLQSVLFILQKVVEFLNQLHEFLMVLFLCDPLTQDMHAFSFIRGHGASRSDCAGNYSIADGRVNRNRRDSVQSQI
jgi:hypothetical protein